MDYNSWTFTLILLLPLWRQVASQGLQSPSNVTVVLQDGEVTLVWAPPAWAPLEANYKVQLTKYSSPLNWRTVPGCEQVRSIRCDLTDLITPFDLYWARVLMAKGEMTSKWSKSKRFCQEDSKLLRPTFTLSSSSTSVKVRVHRKPALKAAFRHGLLYTYHLQEKGQNNMVNKSALWTGDKEEEEEDVEFDYLTSGREYCVHMKVEHVAGIATSEASSDQCVLLPQPEWYTAAVVVACSLSSLVLLGLLSLLLNCCLWQPKRLPNTLECPRSAWRPLILGEVSVEKVTDQGWFLISEKKGRELGEKQKAIEDEEGQARRGSMDSGVSMDQPLSENGGRGAGDGGDHQKQEDSGFGSLGGTDSDSGGSRQLSVERPLVNGRSPGPNSPQKEDSGLGLGCGIRYNDSRILQGEDCGDLPAEGVGTGDGYRSQRPSVVVVHNIEMEKPSEGILAETDSSKAITVGYRPSQFSCVCLGKGQCLWCQSAASLPTIKHSTHSDQFPESSIISIPDSYLGKSNPYNGGDVVQRDTSFVCHAPQTESNGPVPLQISVPQFSLACGGLDSSVNALFLSLQDVDVTFS